MHVSDKASLKEYYEKEAKQVSHQEIMYLRGDKHELWWHRKRLAYIVSFLVEIFQNHRISVFADIGCAEGFYVRYVASNHAETYCIGADIASAYVKKAKINCKALNADFVVCDIANLPFRKDSVDVVLCSEVLEHVYDYSRSVCELMRAGKRFLIISFPGHTYLYEVISKIGPLKRFADHLVPDVGHVSEITIRHVYASLRGNYRYFKIKIGAAFPIRVYQCIPSTRLVDLFDNIVCNALHHLGLNDYANIHVMEIMK